MNTPATNLFGEQRITIQGNPLLQDIANHVYQIYQREPSIVNGKSVGEIYRRITLAVYFENGLSLVLKTASKDDFTDWFMSAHTEEEIARAIRWLREHDYIRFPENVVVTAERHRQRIARSVK